MLENRGGNRNRSFALRLRGRVSNRDGVGAKVEIRAGSLRQKLETSAAVPMAAPADVVFGLGAREAPDAVRVIWVSGIVQTEVEIRARRREPGAGVELVELDRKPSSCPYLYAWNGERFEFVTDFLGGGEMGYRLAPGVVSHPDPVEYVRIAPGRLVPRDGRYELRVTNELEEVLYLDRLRLVAIDHPEDVLVFPDEGMTEPPKAERLFAARDPRTPRAFDHRGRDVTERLRGLDRVYVDELPIERIRGYAKQHALTLDLSGPARRRTRCCCSPAGPTTPSRATTWPRTRPACARAAAARGRARGRLVGDRASSRSACPSAGRRRSWWTWPGSLGPSRRVRVVTTMRVLWDQAAVAAPASGRGSRARGARAGARRPARARLLGRGQPRPARAVGLRLRARVLALALEDAARPLHARGRRAARSSRASDDRFVVSKPGDELALSFDAAALPPLRPGIGRGRSCSTATASARRWTSTPRAPTRSCPCPSTP